MLPMRGLLLHLSFLSLVILFVGAIPIQVSDDVSFKLGLRRRALQSANWDEPATFYQSLFISSTGTEVETSITIGSQTFNVLIDTTYPVTWIASTSTQCLESPSGPVRSQDACQFGSLYQPGLSTTKSQINNSAAEIWYPDGSVVRGHWVYEQVTTSGITLPKQQILIADAVYWAKGTQYPGILGLGTPNLQLALNSSNSPVINDASFPPNVSLLTTIFANSDIPSLFSLAIERGTPNASGGFLALGGLPPATFDGQFISTPIMPSASKSGQISNVPIYSNYTIVPDKVVYEDRDGNWTELNVAQNNNSFAVDIRAGSTLNYLPTTISKAINNLFSPAANYSSGFGSYPVACNATAPTIAIQISGQYFVINPIDMILTQEIDLGSLIFNLLNLEIDEQNLVTLLSVLKEIDGTLGNLTYTGVLQSVKENFQQILQTSNAPEMTETVLDKIFDFLDNIGIDVLEDIVGGQICYSGVADTPDGGHNVLGDVFLKNVVAVFDLYMNEMRFASRVYDESS